MIKFHWNFNKLFAKGDRNALGSLSVKEIKERKKNSSIYGNAIEMMLIKTRFSYGQVLVVSSLAMPFNIKFNQSTQSLSRDANGVSVHVHVVGATGSRLQRGGHNKPQQLKLQLQHQQKQEQQQQRQQSRCIC